MEEQLQTTEMGNGYIKIDSSKPNYVFSPYELKDFDAKRHITIEDAKNLLKSQGDSSLQTESLNSAIESGGIKVYEFKGQRYLDRFDIGRVYHRQAEGKGGLSFERYFSRDGENPFGSVGNYAKRRLQIKDIKGEVIFDIDDAEFPESWSENASRIVAQKYFFKPREEKWKEALRQKIGRDHEYSPVNLISRVTNFIADEGFKLGYFATEEDKEIFADELKWLQIHQKFAFNSPVQFNAGIFNEYEIPGTRGNVYWRNPKTGEVSKFEDGEYIHPQSHACFIKGPKDNLESILQHVGDEGSIFEKGSGIGQDIGALRGEGEPLSGGGKASGAMSFFKVYDASAGTIKSGGKSRRAARMTTMRYNHPDIMNFIRAKPIEDNKALVLMQAGFSGGMDGEAYTTVAYQNTNLSVRLDDNFFEQLRNGGEVELRNIKDGKVARKISADRMLKEISWGSWRIGDPGVQYESKIDEMHTSKNSGRISSSNPCSEYMFLDDTSCNLLSHNLLAYSDDKGDFNVEDFVKAVGLTTVASDILNDASSYPVKDIAAVSPEFRTIGVGYANLGALLMRRGVAYDSNEGRALAAAITAVMTGVAYETSADMAKSLGSFTHFEFNKKPMIDVMRRHQKNLENVLWENVPEELKEAAYSSWEKVVENGEKFGFRNAQASVLAPTGTISYLMDCDTTGVEPGISLMIYKELAGGGTIKLVNKEVPNALRNLGYSEKQIEDISDYIAGEISKGVNRNTVIGAPHMNPDHYDVFATAFGNSKGEGAIPFQGHVKMLGATQPFISGAISKTNNLPESATVKDVYDGYLLGYELGLKALAVFRNNSKPISALNFGVNGGRKLARGEKEDMPERRNAFESEVTIGDTPFHVIVSEYQDGRPGQITFLSYRAGSTLGALLSTSGVLASRALKRGVELEDTVGAWIGQEFEPHGLVHGHPYIKTATSPLDFAAKMLLLEYKGQADFAEHGIEVDRKKLRGAQNGAFRTYERKDIDEWNMEQVLNDPELGGFNKESESEARNNNHSNNSSVNGNSRGVTCSSCGNIMRQTAPGCYSCDNCGDKVGGCGI